MKKITLLAASALLFLTACGQVENSPAEVAPPTTAVVQQPQATPELTTTAQKPDTVPITTQEQPQKENAHQEESTPQATDTPEPVAAPTPTEAIPSETVHAKTGYIWNQSLRRNRNPLPNPRPRQTGRQPPTRSTPMR